MTALGLRVMPSSAVSDGPGLQKSSIRREPLDRNRQRPRDI